MAILLAKKEGGSLHLLHVFEPIGEHAFGHPKPRIDHENGVRYVAARAEKLRADTNLQVSTSTREGTVEAEIMAEAERVADLVVMATHGRGVFSRFWLGSVADACIRGSETPVLLVRPEDEETTGPPQGVARVVVPLDGSRIAQTALPIGEHLARTLRVPFHLVQSISYPVGFAFNHVGAEWTPAVSAEGIAWANRYMEDKVAEVRGRGIEPTPHVVMDERPSKAILDVAGEGGLVVIATHSVGGIGRALLGSVTDKVVRGALGPVLVVRPPNERSANTPRAPTRRTRSEWPPVVHGP
jgi:nucleotide-binding universal stress UspA family protein